MSSYLYAICAGPYAKKTDIYEGKFGRYPLAIFVRPSLSQYLDHEEIFEVTKQGFKWFEDKFQIGYPFKKYDQVFVPEFNAGAMENVGCVTFPRRFHPSTGMKSAKSSHHPSCLSTMEIFKNRTHLSGFVRRPFPM